MTSPFIDAGSCEAVLCCASRDGHECAACRGRVAVMREGGGLRDALEVGNGGAVSSDRIRGRDASRDTEPGLDISFTPPLRDISGGRIGGQATRCLHASVLAVSVI